MNTSSHLKRPRGEEPVCKECGDDDIVTDTKAGHVVCNNCGCILQERVVSDDWLENYNSNMVTASTADVPGGGSVTRPHHFTRKHPGTEHAREHLKLVCRDPESPVPGYVASHAESIFNDLVLKFHFKQKTKQQLSHCVWAIVIWAYNVAKIPKTMAEYTRTFGFSETRHINKEVVRMGNVLKLHHYVPTDRESVFASIESIVQKVCSSDPVHMALPGRSRFKANLAEINRIMRMWDVLEANSEHAMVAAVRSRPGIISDYYYALKKASKVPLRARELSAVLARHHFDPVLIS